jgi:hypothetical protein
MSGVYDFQPTKGVNGRLTAIGIYPYGGIKVYLEDHRRSLTVFLLFFLLGYFFFYFL